MQSKKLVSAVSALFLIYSSWAEGAGQNNEYGREAACNEVCAVRCEGSKEWGKVNDQYRECMKECNEKSIRCWVNVDKEKSECSGMTEIGGGMGTIWRGTGSLCDQKWDYK